MTDKVPARHYDVVIVGAGIAGSAMALALADGDLKVALIEAAPPVSAPALDGGVDGFDRRVSAITPESAAFFEHLRAWDAITAQRTCPYAHMTVWDAEGTGEIEFDAAELGAGELGRIIENRVIVHGLHDELGACANVAQFRPARLEAVDVPESGLVSVALDSGRRLSADLLVAADGALSPVREMLGFRTREWNYDQRALVATVRTEQDHGDTAWQRFLTSGPLALLPLPRTDDENFVSIVWSLDEAAAEELLELDDAAFAAALTRASEQRLGRVLEVSARAAFPLRQRHAVDYVSPGVALVGDAAHTIHPLAGQGINLGLKDVAVLAEEVLVACDRGQSPGSMDCLRRYQRRRKGDNLLMMTAMEGFKRLFGQRALPLRWLRNAGMREVARRGGVKQQLMRHAMGLHLPQG